MHGERQINEEVFSALRALADRDRRSIADLAVHRAHGQRRSHQHDDRSDIRPARHPLPVSTSGRSPRGIEKVLFDLETRLTGLGADCR